MFLIKNLKKIILKLFSPITNQLDRIITKQSVLETRLEYIRESLGRIESRQCNENLSLGLFNSEFKVFSQWGEDGIIQYLIKNIEIKRKIFVEFGVEDYRECNTRFLLINNNWSGLVIEQDEECIKRIKTDKVYWLYNLKAVQATVTKDNINEILENNGVTGEIGLLSIDIDGNDYWIWKAIDVINPIIVIVEYNHRFGSNLAVTIPYNENFNRQKIHDSKVYYGTSLKALCLLAKEKEYAFVGCSSNGVNAFFIRKDKKPDTIKELTVEEGYVFGQFCEGRDENGVRVKTSPEEESLLLANLNLPLVQIDT
jgi:hypothetical protein